MNIFINEEKIDFKLENETMLFQVVEGLSGWASGDGFFIDSIRYDNNLYSETTSCRELPVSEISELRVTAKNYMEFLEEKLQLLYQYVSLLMKSIEGCNTNLIKELQAESETVTKLLADFLGEDHSLKETISRKLYENLMTLNPEAVDDDNELLETLIMQLSGLKIILNERILELANPLGELQKTVKAMKTSVSEINNISILLQTGKDREALNCIIKFSELSQKILRIYPILKSSGIVDVEKISVNDMDFSEFYIELNSILSELLEAFTANDSVLIGDLLEYEVAPRIDSLIKALDSIPKER